MSVATFATIAASIGLGAILTKLLDNTLDWVKGRHKKSPEGWRKFDRESRKRRMLEETLHETRLYVSEQGIPLEDLPDWPSYPKDCYNTMHNGDHMFTVAYWKGAGQRAIKTFLQASLAAMLAAVGSFDTAWELPWVNSTHDALGIGLLAAFLSFATSVGNSDFTAGAPDETELLGE